MRSRLSYGNSKCTTGSIVLSPWGSSAVESAFQRGKVQLLQFEHRGEDALYFRLVGIRHHVDEAFGDDLPCDAEAVLEPAALLRFHRAALAQLAPEVVDF